MTTSKSSRKSKSMPGKNDAIALLKADHRQVEEAFEQFDKAEDVKRCQEIAMQICTALKIHTRIEHEIFYPAFLSATSDTDTHHEAEVEHEAAKKLIDEIEQSSSDDEWFKAKVTVLSEMIKHHVNEEEKRGGMFSEARDSDMDLVALGEQLAARKAELEKSGGEGADEDAEEHRGTQAARSARGDGEASAGMEDQNDGEDMPSSRGGDGEHHRHAGR